MRHRRVKPLGPAPARLFEDDSEWKRVGSSGGDNRREQGVQTAPRFEEVSSVESDSGKSCLGRTVKRSCLSKPRSMGRGILCGTGNALPSVPQGNSVQQSFSPTEKYCGKTTSIGSTCPSIFADGQEVTNCIYWLITRVVQASGMVPSPIERCTGSFLSRGALPSDWNSVEPWGRARVACSKGVWKRCHQEEFARLSHCVQVTSTRCP